MSSQPLPVNWTDDATWLVQAIDPKDRLIRLIRMNDEAYRRASFLDDRVLGDAADARLCSLDEAVAAAVRIGPDRAGWIFHIGHVGSTLVSRLLATWARCWRSASRARFATLPAPVTTSGRRLRLRSAN